MKASETTNEARRKALAVERARQDAQHVPFQSTAEAKSFLRGRYLRYLRELSGALQDDV